MGDRHVNSLRLSFMPEGIGKTIDNRFQVHKNNMDRMNGGSIKNDEAQSSKGKNM